MQKLSKQIAQTLIFSGVIAALVLGLQQIEGSETFIHSQIWTILIFSAVLGLIIVGMSHWGVKNLDPQSRTNLFLGITVLRLIFSMVFIGIVLFRGVENQMIWVADFFVVYLFYLVFEIYTILSNLRQISG